MRYYLAILAIVTTAVVAYQIGSHNVTRASAQRYMSSHCELMSNQYNTNDKWYECDQ